MPRLRSLLPTQLLSFPQRTEECHRSACGLCPVWGKLRAAEQLARALDQIATLQSTPALRREQISLQVALITPLIHVKGYAAPETKAAVERARLLIEEAQARGEPPEDPLLLFSVLYGFWVANFVAFNGDICRDLARRFLALAAKHGTAAPPMIGRYIMGNSSLFTGDLVEARASLRLP